MINTQNNLISVQSLPFHMVHLVLHLVLFGVQFASYTFAQHHVISNIMCCASNHENNIDMAQWHISLPISPFLVIYANT
jgi:hypothetical protein